MYFLIHVLYVDLCDYVTQLGHFISSTDQKVLFKSAKS